MKDNYNLKIEGQKVCLVPYRRKFVPLYNKWMKDPMLLQLTASEPLSLEEEHSMQQSWCEDPKKCTFIILLRKERYPQPLNDFSDDIEIMYMCGDVNLFFNNYDDPGEAEIEIMIADSQCWRKGVASEALSLMMGYGLLRLGVTRYFAKIGSKNEASRNLFLKLGFEQCNYVECFDEYEYQLQLDSQARRDNILHRVAHMVELDYEPSS